MVVFFIVRGEELGTGYSDELISEHLRCTDLALAGSMNSENGKPSRGGWVVEYAECEELSLTVPEYAFEALDGSGPA